MLSISEQCITIRVSISTIQGLKNMCISFVYGLHTLVESRELWQELSTIGTQKSPWLILGDFNAVFNIDQRINGALITETEIKDGNICMQKLELQFLKTIGLFYSWNKGSQGDHRIFSRGHSMRNKEWMGLYGEIYVEYLPSFIPRL